MVVGQALIPPEQEPEGTSRVLPLVPDVHPGDKHLLLPGTIESAFEQLMMGDAEAAKLAPEEVEALNDDDDPVSLMESVKTLAAAAAATKKQEAIDEVHEHVLSEALKAPDMPDIQPVLKVPEFQDIPEDATITDFEPAPVGASKVPDFPDIPEGSALELTEVKLQEAFAEQQASHQGTPRTLSRHISRDSLYDEVFDPTSASASAAASRRNSLTFEINQLMLEQPDLFRTRRSSAGSMMSEAATTPGEFRSRHVSESGPDSPDCDAATQQVAGKFRKMSVVSMAARPRRASESAARPEYYSAGSPSKTPRFRRFSVNVSSLGNPKVGRRMRRFSEVSDVVQESLAMLKASKIPVPKFMKVAKGVSRCCRHPSREELKLDPIPGGTLPAGVSVGAVVDQCKCCGRRRFSTAATSAFGVAGPPVKLSTTDPPSCLVCSPVVCQGDLLRVVQLAGVFPDSKTFVDKKVKLSPEETIRQFQDLLQRTGGAPTRDQVIAFVDQSFEDGDELEEWQPRDWKESPALLERIRCPEFRAWASELNRLWMMLGRKMKDDVRDRPQLYSLMYVPNGFIIPGGRFKELYYWDTYWIVQGLLICDMKESVKGIIENLLCLVERLGFVPNGSRVYYDERSQPPLLLPMVQSYLQSSGDMEFVRDNIDTIEREFLFWINNATVEVNLNNKTYRLARYFSPSDGPRPESYREDVLTAAHLATEEERQHLYWDIKSAAATGWDFSSRWVIHDGTNGGTLGDLHTRYIVPVDLNAFLYGNAVALSDLFRQLGREDRARKYRTLADEWREAVTAVLWHPDLGAWLDYDLLNATPRRYFYASNLTPLWTRCYDEGAASDIARVTMRYLFNTGVLKYLGGTPMSLMMTGEQWDFPNCWSPVQGMLIQGLHRTGDPGAQRLALELARRWLVSNYKGFLEHRQMFEKYEVEAVGRCGGGGEYSVQAGFGWTNGVCLELLDQYGMVASARDDPELLTYEILVEAEDKVLDTSPMDSENKTPDPVPVPAAEE